MSETNYDASKSSTKAETVVEFLESYQPGMDIEEVPGIGPATSEQLQNNGVETIQALLGLYLSGVAKDVDTQTVCETFFVKLKELCPKVNAHTVTFAIAHLADHLNLFIYED